MSEPRKARVNITYIPKGEATARTASAMATYQEGFTYVDAASGESDTISIKFNNRDLRWANRWMPQTGDKIKATIKVQSWDKEGKDKSYACGKFCCDDLKYAGPNLTLEIGGTSVPEGQDFRATARSYTWQMVTLQEMAMAIAARYELTLVYDANIIYIESIEQSEQTDCEFLNSVCETYGLFMKVYYGKLVIYDIDLYEEKPAVATYSIKELQDWSYDTTLTATYTGAIIKYTCGDDDTELTLSVGEEGRMLNLSEKVDSVDDAFAKACAAVNKENRNAVIMSATIRANLKLAAGCNIRIKDAYQLNGKYFIDKITHNIGDNGVYTMDLEMHLIQEKIKTLTNSSAVQATTDAATALAVGDQVLVNGNAYYGGNGGTYNVCNNETMYITEIIDESYAYRYGVAKRQGGTRYGWCAETSLTKLGG